MICDNVREPSLHFSFSQELEADSSEMLREAEAGMKGGKWILQYVC